MSTTQRVILAAGMLVFLGMSVVPPWYELRPVRGASRSRPLGHALIFAPPAPSSGLNSVRVDLERLGVYWLTVLVLTGGGVLLARRGGRDAS